jgi:preprotein translocase subunit SecE
MPDPLTEKPGAIAKKETVKMAGAAKPAVVTRKDGPFQKLNRYLNEVRVELKKTTWPSKQELIASTEVVLGVVIVVGLYIALTDGLLSWITRPLFQH